MQAKLTRCLFGNSPSKLVIKTCSEILVYMDEIYNFIYSLNRDDCHFAGKNPCITLKSNFVSATIIIRGRFLESNLPEIEQFIMNQKWRK